MQDETIIQLETLIQNSRPFDAGMALGNSHINSVCSGVMSKMRYRKLVRQRIGHEVHGWRS